MGYKPNTPDYIEGRLKGYDEGKIVGYNKGYRDACFYNSKLVIIVTAAVLAVSGVLYAIE